MDILTDDCVELTDCFPCMCMLFCVKLCSLSTLYCFDRLRKLFFITIHILYCSLNRTTSRISGHCHSECSDWCVMCIDSHVWICLLCKLPFRHRKSYEIHHHSKHMMLDSCYKHSCVHCGRRFRQSRQLQLHKCRPENYASNIQKEMRQRDCHRFTTATVEYVGPTFVRVQRHDDILTIVGDIFSHAHDDDDDVDTFICDNANTNVSWHVAKLSSASTILV